MSSNSFLQCKRSNDEFKENLQWRQHLLSIFERLGEKDQTPYAMQYLINQVQSELNLNQLQFYMDCIIENTDSLNNIGKKEVIKLLGIMISSFKNRLSNYLNKIISFLLKRLIELPSSGLLEITLETFGVTCNNITIDQKHLTKIQGGGMTTSNNSGGTPSGLSTSLNSASSATTQHQQQILSNINNNLLDVYLIPIFSIINQPSRHIQTASILAIQKVIENIYDINTLLKPQIPKITNQLLKKLMNTTQLPSPNLNGSSGSSSMSSFSTQYCIPHIISCLSSLFKTIGPNYFQIHNALSSVLIEQINGNLISNAIRTISSNDWTARLSSATLFQTIVETLPKSYYSNRVSDILKSLNDCKYDKIKSIRDCVNKSIQLYNQSILISHHGDDDDYNIGDQQPNIPTTPPYIEAKLKQQIKQEQQQHQHYQQQHQSNSSSLFSSPPIKSPRKMISPSSPQTPSQQSSQSSTYKKYTPLSSPTISSQSSSSSNSSSISSSTQINSRKTINQNSSNSSNNTPLPTAFKTSPTPSYSNSPILKPIPKNTPITNHFKEFSISTSSLSTSPLIFSNHKSDQSQHHHHHNQHNQQQFHYHYTSEEDEDIETSSSNGNGSDDNKNILTLSALGKSTTTTSTTTTSTLSPKPTLFSPPLKPMNNYNKNNNINSNNNNNKNNDITSTTTSSPTSSPKLNIKPKETITTTTTITTDENETLKLLHEMMNSMNEFMVETRTNIDSIKTRLSVVESSVLTLQKFYLSK